MILAFKVRSREDLAAARAALAEDVGDAVDLSIKSCLSHAPREPLSCSDVLGGERRAMHASLVSAEGCKGPQVRQHPLRLDGCHSLARVVRQCSDGEAGRYPSAYRIGECWTIVPA